METTKTNEALLEGAKVAEKWFNDATTTMMDMYNKQTNLTKSFYSNLFGSVLGNNNGWNTGKNIADTFLPNNDLAKMMWAPFNSAYFTNSFANPFEKMFKQMTDYSQNILSSFTKTTSGNGADWDTITKKYQESMENQLEASKKIMNSMMETFNKQIEVATESDKKLMEEFNNQFNLIVKQNQEFLANMLNTFQAPLKEERSFKEDGVNSAKKQSKAIAVA